MKVWILSAAVLLISFHRSLAVDRNGNGMSEVWEMIYNATALPPNAGTDGDGFTNLEESKAGTNPFDATSFPLLKLSFLFPSTAQATWESFPGKRYTLQPRSVLTDSWTNEISLIAASALSQTNFNATDASKFFRLSISDADTDADGVSDYAALARRFNPNRQRTDRYDLTDFSRITNGLVAASVVTASALAPLMFERWPDPGLVALRRSGGLLPITVNFAPTERRRPWHFYHDETEN